MMGAFGAYARLDRLRVELTDGGFAHSVTPGGGNGSNVEIPEYTMGLIRPAGRILRGDA